MLCNNMGPNSALTTCTRMTEKNYFIVTKSVSFLTPSQLHRSSEAWFTVQSNYCCKIPWLSSRTLLLHASDGVAPRPDVCSCAFAKAAPHRFLSLLCAKEEDSLKAASLVFLPTSPGHVVLRRQSGRQPTPLLLLPTCKLILTLYPTVLISVSARETCQI